MTCLVCPAQKKSRQVTRRLRLLQSERHQIATLSIRASRVGQLRVKTGCSYRIGQAGNAGACRSGRQRFTCLGNNLVETGRIVNRDL